MPIQFECTTSYLGKEITVKTDDFKSLHQALAKVDELNRDANFLAKRAGTKKLRPDFRRDNEGNEYYGVAEKGGRRNVSFGQLREGGYIPFFPKGEEGYYDPDSPPQRNGRQNGHQNGRRQNGNGQRRQEAPPEQQTQAPQPAAPQPDDGLPF